MDGRFELNVSVSIRPSTPAESAVLSAGRDAESRRFLAEGSPDPRPAFCIEVSGEIVGWVDFDTDRTWLLPAEVNVGYNVFPANRARGYATCAVRLLFDYLTADTDHSVATLLINPDNEPSLGVARRLGCERQPDFDGNAYFKVKLRK